MLAISEWLNKKNSRRWMIQLGIVVLSSVITMMLIWHICLKGVLIISNGDTVNILRYYIVIGLLLNISILGVGLWEEGTEKVDFRIKFFVAILWIGLINNVIVVPFSVPDEGIHFAQSYEISNRILGIKRPGNDLRIPIEEKEMIWLFDAKEGIQKTYKFFEPAEKEASTLTVKDSFVRDVNLALYPYAPAAIGIAIGRALVLPYQAILILGRMFNLLFLALCVVLAMTIYQPLKYAFAGICLLPATVALSAAYTYDVWNLAGILLFVAFCFRFRERRVRIRETLVMGLIFATYVPIKFIYALIGVGIFFIPFKKWNKKHLAIIVTGAVAAILAVIYSKGQEIVALLFTNQMDERGRSTTEAVSYSIGYLLRNPLDVFKVFIKTGITQSATFVFNSAVGEVMAARYPHVPSFIAAAVIVIFITLMMISIKDCKLTKWDKVLSFSIFFGGVIAIYFVFLFTYSTIPVEGVGVVAGIQGRYFTPFYIMLPILVHSCKASEIVRNMQLSLNPMSTKLCEQEWLVTVLVLLNLVVLYCKFVGIAMV